MTTVLAFAAPRVAEAAVANCVGPDGSCEISNDPEDQLLCNCADGSGGGFGGGNMWAGLTEMELQPICDVELVNFCGGGFPPPPPGLPCNTANGMCIISNVPFDSIDCECADGSAFGFGGGNAWAGLSDPDLIMVCEGVIDTECAAGPPPPPPAVECSSDLGVCSVNNVPEDTVSCECADGSTGGNSGGSTWEPLSPKELEGVCQEQILVYCEQEGGSTGDPGETEGSTGDEAGSEGTTGGDTTGDNVDDSGTAGGSGVGETGTPGSTGDGGNESSSGGSAGDTQGGGGGGGGCSVAPRGGAGAAGALALLGLLGLGRRRRRVV